jgi:DNA-binding XRE family transcriptional regulator
VDLLHRLLEKAIPGIEVEIDRPTHVTGEWFIDVGAGDRSFVIQFRPEQGFGITSTPTEGFNEAPDEILQDETLVVKRVAALVRARARTEPRRVRILQELRERRNVLQTAVAKSLRVRQPTISKLERREDVGVKTLRKYVQALGGVLHVTATFADEAVEIDPTTHAKAAKVSGSRERRQRG